MSPSPDEAIFDAGDPGIALQAIPPAVLRPRRILASAGTGKTYTLSGRYLGLVLAGVDPATILATTFTRAAAAEIRDRVFRDLAALVVDAGKRAKEASRFESVPVTASAAEAGLERLVDALPDLQIRTLDSVFAGLARGLGPASGLAAEASLVDGEAAAALLREAIGEAIEVADEDEVLDTLETLGRGATKVGVVSTVESAVVGLLAGAGESTPEAWHWRHPPRDEALLERLRSIDAVLEAAIPDLKSSQAKAATKVRTQIAEAAERDGAIWIDLVDSTLVAAAGPNGSRTYSRSPIDEAILPSLAELHAIACEGNLRNLARRTACLRHLVDEIAPRYRLAKRRARAAEFDDYTRALDPFRGGLEPEALGELWFRLDTRLEHLLLDEFQDTSATQLRAIRPLAEEILAGGDGDRPRSLLVVGDVKQSIYGWRGGDPAILARLGAALQTDESAMPPESLVKSWRSSRAVVDLVNQVFDGIGSNRAVLEKSSSAASEFAALWNAHDTALVDLPGEAVVEFLPEPDADEEEDRTSVLATAAAASAAALVERHPHGRVAVIVRSNKVVGPIVEALRARGVAARGQGSGSLLDAEAATAVIQAFRLAADPSDTLAAEDLARSPLGPLVDLAARTDEPHRRVDGAARRRVASRLRRRFDTEGAAVVVDDWRRRLVPRLTVREAARLRQIVELLDGLDRTLGGPRTPGAIAAHLCTCRVADPGGDGVAVMTVHQSKGLEFEGVVVTEMHQPLFRRPAVAFATPDPPADPVDRVSTWYRESARPAEAAPIHQQATDRIVTESLCGLYVAMTRAARDLVVHVPRPAFTRDGEPAADSLPTWGGVVREAIGVNGESHAAGAASDAASETEDGGGVSDPKTVSELVSEPVSEVASGLEDATVVLRLVHGSPGEDGSSSTESDPASSPAKAESTGATTRLNVVPRGPRRRAITAPPPSSGHGRTDLGRRSDPEALERGSVVHALFEAIERADDVDRLDGDELVAIARRTAPARDEAWHRARVASVQAALGTPAVRQAYDGTDGPALVRVEFPFLRRTPQGAQAGFIDRLVLHLDRPPGGRDPATVEAATIIDFKTDRPQPDSPNDVADFLGRHRDQMETYRSVIRDRYGLAEDRVRVLLLRVDDARVVPVPASVE